MGFFWERKENRHEVDNETVTEWLLEWAKAETNREVSQDRTEKSGERDVCSTPWHFDANPLNLPWILFIKATCSRCPASLIESWHSCSSHAQQLETTIIELGEARKAAMRTWGGGGDHRKSLTSVLWDLSVATAVSGSAEQVTSRGFIWRKNQVPAFKNTLLHNLLEDSMCCLASRLGTKNVEYCFQ